MFEVEIYGFTNCKKYVDDIAKIQIK